MTRSSNEEPFRQHLPQALVLLRKSRGFTQQELAERVNIQQPVLCRYETGASTPTSARLAQVLHAMVASWTDLDLALAEVKRAEEHGDTPSEEAVLEQSDSTTEDLMFAFMNASQNGRGEEFIREIIEQARYMARLQSRLNVKKVFEDDEELPTVPKDGDHAANGDGSPDEAADS